MAETPQTAVAVLDVRLTSIASEQSKCQADNAAEHQRIHDRLSAHCNGGSNHVSRREMDATADALERLTETVQRLAVTVASLQSEQTLWGKLQIPVATGLVMAVIVALLNRYIGR